jgi:hypothetical protein
MAKSREFLLGLLEVGCGGDSVASDAKFRGKGKSKRG